MLARKMNLLSRRPVTAVLGPTNTGKTHLAVERMCAHSSGMIGFPLRLLAREIYDRVVAIKGPGEVALVTGEERIAPPGARWTLCTVESMPTDADVSFLAIDEAQLGADPERGHVFTDRLLHARGRDETMILGSGALAPMVRALLPEAEIETRPRFSTLSYAGARKLSRLPRRSVVVAFSAEEVYAVAEMLRRFRGGAAVVMGALSPATRNAQVAMFQAGEVDYLVATDAVGMGLNMDVDHVAFAGLSKFDGRRRRRLTIAEMAQIAGRAGRHHRDGSFGSLTAEGPDAFRPEEVEAIEAHRVPHLEHLFWREGAPDFASIDALIASLETKPADPVLRAAPQAVDLAVLAMLAGEDWVRERTRGPAMVRRLWAACGIPDFRKLGAEPHGRFVARLYRHLSEGNGTIPHDWFASEIARLDDVQGDVETVAGRIAAIRSWAYIAHRRDWLADPDHWAARTREIEARLSDALHQRLTQRFVDRRTSALLRQLRAGVDAMPVEIGEDGAVLVDGEPIGTLKGFRFAVAGEARAADKRMLLAAAEKRLAGELARRAAALVADEDGGFAIDEDAVRWRGVVVATLGRGPRLARPAIVADGALGALDPEARRAVIARIERWLAAMLDRHAPLFAALDEIARDSASSPALRAVTIRLAEQGGFAARVPIAAEVEALDQPARRRLRKAGVTIGALDLFDARLLRPAAARWRALLLVARDGAPIAPAPEGASVLARDARPMPPGFRAFGAQLVRIDLVERLARQAHDARQARAPFLPDAALATSIGLTLDSHARLLRLLGFVPMRGADDARWRWAGGAGSRPPAPPPRAAPGNPFAAFAQARSGDG